MSKIVQRVLLVLAIVATIGLIVEIVITLFSTQHSSQPVQTREVNAGPYALTVKLYKYPADAGFALPFAVAPSSPVAGHLSYDISSIPDRGVDATPVHASQTSDPQVANGVQCEAEITVRGNWNLQITVHGPQGSATASLPIEAIAPPAVAPWLGWLVGFIPFFGLLFFLFAFLAKRKGARSVAA